MDKFIVNGGKKLYGEISVSGAKNVALKAIVAACLTDEEVVIKNIPHISDLFVMVDIVRHLGGDVVIKDHEAKIRIQKLAQSKISLETAAEIRTSFMFLAPLLARTGHAIIPNPGGCRIGARPIDRMVDGLQNLGVVIRYDSGDGYFHAKTDELKGATYRFDKNTHTGTETLLLASVLAKGSTVLENAAEEPEVDDLIQLLNAMGARIHRKSPRTIFIEGVSSLHGTTFFIAPDRNEVVTFAIAAIIANGDIFIKDINKNGIEAFLEKLEQAGGGFEIRRSGIRFFAKGPLRSSNIITAPSPGFMTDWQGPWAVLMTKAEGESVIHETIYENRFGYVGELKKMGAHISFFQPSVSNPKDFYNFNLDDDTNGNAHAIRIKGSVLLHNGVVSISDLRAGATLVLAALAAKGETVIFGVEHLDRGYEQFEVRLQALGANIRRTTD